MATKVHMEALSPTMEEGQLVRWLKSEGDSVSEGDVLAEIETDKATMELVARGSGVLRNVTLPEGGTAPVGQVIAVIAEPGEEVGEEVGLEARARPAEEGAVERPAPAKRKEEKQRPAAKAKTVAAPAERPTRKGKPAEEIEEEEELTGASRERAEAAVTGRPDGRVKASPLARRLASEAGLELERVRGSGPGGRITKADIEAAIRVPGGQAARPAAAQPRVVVEGAEVEEVPASQLRKTIARRLVTSIGPVPTFYLTIDVDMRRMTQVRERVNARLEKEGVKASINDFIIKAVAAALTEHPEVNASWADTVIRRYRRVHIGVAVAVDDGLITPVIRDADRKVVREIAEEVQDLAERARAKRLKPEEYTGATFTVSNLGMFGIEEFTAIINPPEGAILAIGKVEDRVVAEGGQPVVRPRMRVTMSCDHRVIDGATGARFLQTLKEILEEPMMMLA